MSNDFRASFKAVLDTSKIKEQITDLQNDVKKNGILKLKLDFDNSSIDVKSLNNSLSRNLSSIGANAGQSFAKSISSSLNKIHLVNGSIGNVKNMLQGAGFDTKSINSITQDLNKMVLTINKINTSQLSNGNIKMTISGVDELGRAVNIVRTFDKETGNVINTTKSFSQSFSKTVKGISDSAKATLSNIQLKIDTGDFQTKINNVKSSLDSLENGSESASKNIALLEAVLRTMNSSTATPKEKIQAYREFNSILSTTKAQLSEVKNAEGILSNIQFKIETGDIQQKFDSIKNKYESLAEVSEKTTSNFERLKTVFDTMNDTNIGIEDKVEAYKEFNDLLPVINRQLSELTKSEKTVFQGDLTSIKSDTLLNKVNNWADDNTKAAEQYKTELEKIKALLMDKRNPVSLRNASVLFQEVTSKAKAAGLVTNKFFEKLKDTTKQLLGLTSTIAVIQKAIDLFKKMYSEVYDIDTAMTNLKKVTNETDSSYSKFLSRATVSAKELGRTVSGMVTQTSEWAKLGYSLEEAEELSKWSAIYANVGEVDDETAVSDMVTAMKAFNIEASKAQTIVDSLNELGNNFAISAADLGNGLSTSASAMNAAGTDMYKTLAMLTGGSEITQNASEFGNFLKTSSMRIRGMKGELEELGEEVDESVDSISKIQTQILNLTHGKVNIFDDAGEFRDYYDIMKDISDVVDDLTSTERASLYEILFGKTRGNQGAALIQAFQSGQIEKAYADALNSDGSAMAEQTKWLDSLEGKNNQLKAAWQELTNTILDSDFLKGCIDAGTTLLSVLSKIINTIGGFNTALIATRLTLFIKNFD